MKRYKNTDLVFYLSLVLDKDGYEKKDLITSNRLDNLDNYIKKNFKDHRDVRRKYDEEIGEYCLQNMKFIQEENQRNHRNWTGAITILFPVEEYNYEKSEYELKYIKLPIFYKDGKELKSEDECLKIIREKLKDREMVKKLFHERGFLLSEDEIRYYFNAEHYINGIISGGEEKDNFDDFGDTFCKRLKNLPKHIKYYYLRCLTDMFGLFNEHKKERVRVKSVKGEKLSKIDKVELNKKKTHEIINYEEEITPERESVEVEETAPDEFKYVFYKALDTGDYDTLYNMYSIDEIERYSNLLKEKRK